MSYISIIEACRNLKIPEDIIDFNKLNDTDWPFCDMEFDQEFLDSIRNTITFG